MEYEVNVSIRENISEKEKDERIKQFQNAFVVAAVDFFLDKEKSFYCIND